MKLIKASVLALLGAAWLGTSLHAQSTNIFHTDIESFEAQTNVLIVKGFGSGDTVSVGGGVLTMRLKESYSPGSGTKLQALVLDFTEGQFRERAVIDYAEIPSLLAALDYIRSASYDVTGLPAFEAVYQTKDGFRVLCVGTHRQSSVQAYVQFDGCQRIPLNSDQMAQLRGAITQGKNSLDDLKPK